MCLMWPKSLNEVLIEKWQILPILLPYFIIYELQIVTMELKLQLFCTEVNNWYSEITSFSNYKGSHLERVWLQRVPAYHE